MHFKLTLRYIMMVLISTILLLGTAFFVLTSFENSNQNNSLRSPIVFAYNFHNEIELDNNEEIIISEQGMEALIEEEAWLQILNDEGYVIQAFNTPDFIAEHYSPHEITYMNQSKSYQPDYLYEIGKTQAGLNYLVAVPSGNWYHLTLDINQQMIRQFGKIMLALTAVILLIMGFIFSRKIAKPVSKIIGGVENLSSGDYKTTYTEKGLYRSIFVRLNQLAIRLKNSELEQEKNKRAARTMDFKYFTRSKNAFINNQRLFRNFSKF